MAASLLRGIWSLVPIAASAAWAYYLFYVSTDPSPAVAGGGRFDFLPRPDLWGHFGFYGIFGLLLIWAVWPVRTWRPLELAVRVGLPVVIGGSYGVAMEMLQADIAERSAEFVDGVANVSGAAAAVAFVYVMRRVLRRGRR